MGQAGVVGPNIRISTDKDCWIIERDGWLLYPETDRPPGVNYIRLGRSVCKIQL